VDWTAAMRAAPHVMEYVLVGETDDGICGQPWGTWGYDGADTDSMGSDEDKGRVDVPPYVADGFERVELVAVSAAGQVCRTDERWRRARQSRTVSFRRLAR